MRRQRAIFEVLVPPKIKNFPFSKLRKKRREKNTRGRTRWSEVDMGNRIFIQTRSTITFDEKGEKKKDLVWGNVNKISRISIFWNGFPSIWFTVIACQHVCRPSFHVLSLNFLSLTPDLTFYEVFRRVQVVKSR